MEEEYEIGTRLVEGNRFVGALNNTNLYLERQEKQFIKQYSPHFHKRVNSGFQNNIYVRERKIVCRMVGG